MRVEVPRRVGRFTWKAVCWPAAAKNSHFRAQRGGVNAVTLRSYSNPNLNKDDHKDEGDELLLILIILGGIAAAIIGTSPIWGPPVVL